MRRKAIYVLLTAVFILSHTVRATCQDTITDRPAVLRADIRDLATKAYMFGLLDEKGRDSLINAAGYIIPELEAMRASWEEKLSFLEKLYNDETFSGITDAGTDRELIKEKMLPILLSIPETEEQFGPLTTEQALERIDELLGRDLAYEKRVASMSKGERIAWTIARLLLGGSAAYNPKATPMMNGLWYMPIPPGKPESFDETVFWEKNFDPRVYKSSVPKPVISAEEMLRQR